VYIAVGVVFLTLGVTSHRKKKKKWGMPSGLEVCLSLSELSYPLPLRKINQRALCWVLYLLSG
jgi:hypothetical protein